MESIQELVVLWRSKTLFKHRKLKTRVIRAYMTKFCLSKATADNTLNGRRTPANPEEVVFLSKLFRSEFKSITLP
ncbi:hypothetical protein QE357_002256 [Siphonobacter sp. BAB-5404]|nr:hypothetical protein [Siphonobacter sp. SORGH_AS_0500]